MNQFLDFYPSVLDRGSAAAGCCQGEEGSPSSKGDISKAGKKVFSRIRKREKKGAAPPQHFFYAKARVVYVSIIPLRAERLSTTTTAGGRRKGGGL